MFKRGLLLTIGVRYFLIALPFAQQKSLAACFWGHFQNVVHVSWFHGEDQVVCVQKVAGKLLGAVIRVVAAVRLEDVKRRFVHWFADECADAGGTDLDALVLQALLQHGFGHGAAADIADADDEDGFEHGYYCSLP